MKTITQLKAEAAAALEAYHVAARALADAQEAAKAKRRSRCKHTKTRAVTMYSQVEAGRTMQIGGVYQTVDYEVEKCCECGEVL